MKYLAAGLSAAALLALLGASDARALTLQTINNSNPDGSQRFVDPDEQARVQRLTNPSGGAPGTNAAAPGFGFSVGSGSSAGSSSYIDPSRPPRSAPFGYGMRPLDPSRP